MSKLNREHEPLIERASFMDDDVEQPRGLRRRGSWAGRVFIVLALAACGVGGYYLADSVYLASQRLVPAAKQPGTPVDAPPAVAVAEPAPSSDQAIAQPATPATQPANEDPGGPPSGPTGRRIGDWTLICPNDNAPRTDCALVQRLVDTQKRPVLVWSITRDSDGTVRAMWQTPVDVDRQHGLVLDAGDGKPRSVPFATCAKQYCLVRGILAPNYLITLAAAPRVSVAVNSATGQAVTFTFAPAGLSDGLAWLGGQEPT